MYRFWMNGISARNCVEIRHDFAALNEPGFWVVVGTFEGVFTFARFTEISDEPFSVEIHSKPEIGNFTSSFDRSEYIDYVEKIRASIAKGWVYQVNACRILSAALSGSLEPLMADLIRDNPAPLASFISLPEIEVASASPELFLKVTKELVGDKTIRSALTSPIKGTSTTDVFLEKDYAENVMIVDLMRNDLASVAIPGTTKVPRLLATEKHPGLFHLVSDVSTQLSPEVSWEEILLALMPPGSVSGAPKSSAKAIIAESEPARGPYCGALGWISDGEAQLAVGIRTFWTERKGTIHFGTGSGITWGSDAIKEWEESELKAERLVSIAKGSYASFH